MPVYAWQGRAGGVIQKGEMQAPTKSAVLARLRQMQIQPIPERVKQKGKFLDFSEHTAWRDIHPRSGCFYKTVVDND